MDLATLIPLAIKASIFLMVFGLGLEARLKDTLYLFHRPWQLARSLLAINLILPILVAAMVAALSLQPAVEIALIALAVSPVPPLLPKKQFKAGGEAPYVIGLLVAVSLLSIVVTPAAVALLGRVFAKDADILPLAVAKLIFLAVFVPMASGMLVRAMAPALAEKIGKIVSSIGSWLLVVAVLPVLVTEWPAVVSLIGNGTILAIGGFILAGLTAGHLLGGPKPGDRSTLALSTATRHPGVAMAIAVTNFPGQKNLILAAILLYLIVSGIAAFPYLVWVRKRMA